MIGGWAKIHRKILGNPYLQELDALGLFVKLFTEAAWEDCEKYVPEVKKIIRLKRGEVWISTRSLTGQFTSHKRIRTILKMLESGTLIGTRTGTHGTIVTICNYDKYQTIDENGAHQEAHGGANEGHTRGTPIDKEREEKEESKKDSPPLKPPRPGGRSRPSKRSTTWPEGFALDAEMIAYAERCTPGVDAQADFEKFENNHRAKGSKFVDWRRAWQTWCRSEFAKPMLNQGNGNGSGNGSSSGAKGGRRERETIEDAVRNVFGGVGGGDRDHDNGVVEINPEDRRSGPGQEGDRRALEEPHPDQETIEGEYSLCDEDPDAWRRLVAVDRRL